MQHKESLMYVVMGVSATVFNWGIYSLLVTFLPMELANAGSFAMTLIFAYVTNKIYVFESRSWGMRRVLREFCAFATARGVTGLLEIFLQPQLYQMGIDGALLGVKGLQAKVVVCLTLSIVNYFSTKLIFLKSSQKHLTNTKKHDIIYIVVTTQDALVAERQTQRTQNPSGVTS